MEEKHSKHPQIKAAIEKIAELCSPEKIYIFSSKKDLFGELTSFKICLVVSTTDKLSLERQIYVDIDLDIPFDVVIYTSSEWEEMSNREDSFAYKVKETGVLIYER